MNGLRVEAKSNDENQMLHKSYAAFDYSAKAFYSREGRRWEVT